MLVRQAAGQLDAGRRGGDELYRLFRSAVDWPALLPPGQRFSVEARVGPCTDVPSALLVQTRLRDAVCDAVRDAGCGVPSMQSVLWQAHRRVERLGLCLLQDRFSFVFVHAFSCRYYIEATAFQALK